jgi:hypothetical protein
VNILELVDAKGLDYIHKTEDEIAITCPNSGAHQGGQDSKPSFDINLSGKGAGCFACGYRLGPDQLLKWLLGEALDDTSMRAMALRAKIGRMRAEQSTAKEYDEVFFPPGVPWEEDGYRGISLETYQMLGAVHVTRGRYQNRIAFPVYVRGELQGVDARTLGDDQPKYLRNKNSTCKSTWLYPFDVVAGMVKDMPEGERYVILGEGIFHAIGAYDKGFPALSFFGVNNFSMNKVRMLISLGIDEIIFFADNDVAGRKAEQLILSMCQDWFKITTADVAWIDDGRDLGDLTKEEIQHCLNGRYVPRLPICLPLAKKVEYGSKCGLRRCCHWEFGKCANLLWAPQL